MCKFQILKTGKVLMLPMVTVNRGSREKHSFAFAKACTWLCASWQLPASKEKAKTTRKKINPQRFNFGWQKTNLEQRVNWRVLCTPRFSGFALLADTMSSMRSLSFLQHWHSAEFTLSTSVIHPDWIKRCLHLTSHPRLSSSSLREKEASVKQALFVLSLILHPPTPTWFKPCLSSADRTALHALPREQGRR